MLWNLTYAELTKQTKAEKPYRGTTNKYPLEKRAYSHKNFQAVERDGKIDYDIYYGDWWEKKTITRAEWLRLLPSERSAWEGEWVSGTRTVAGHRSTESFIRWVTHSHRLAIVRDDNTIEFTAQLLGQGHRKLFSDLMGGYMSTSSKHGGVIYVKPIRYEESIVIPIFKGLRLDLTTLKPHDSTDYTITKRVVNRKAAKDMMSEHQNFLKFSETMFKTMTTESFRSQLKEMREEVEAKCEHDTWWRGLDDACISRADELITSDPIGAAMLYMLGWDIGFTRSMSMDYGNGRESDEIVNMSYQYMKKRYCKEMYSKNDAIFNKEVIKWPNLPSTTWAMEVTVNDKEVERY